MTYTTAQKTAYAKAKQNELGEKIDKWIDDLINATDAARKSELIQNYLATVAKFHNYSFSNMLLIMLQCPNASRVAGYKKWQELNRQVRKGEQALKIFAPLIRKDDTGDDEVYGFRAVNVFDLSQTDGKPLPESPDYNQTEIDNAIEISIKKWLGSRSIPLEYKEGFYAYGATNGNKIILNTNTGTHTLLHEVAHVLLHYGKDGKHTESYKGKSKSRIESEAEATAHIVAMHFGIADLDKSANYIALIGSAEDTKESLTLITREAKSMIAHIEKSLAI